MTDYRAFICYAGEVLEVHDLAELADEGVLTPATHDGELYATDSPRAWVEAWRTDCCGWSTVRLGESLVEQAVRVMNQ
ncbi:hypothetical protein [Haloarcula sp. K1]|uniref:hypothetical protein n=1 Tax=Haloarcula sp. K1 TaxID=1622207 RepID=UPI0007BB5B07|nr:hypothetical protein [Haloarcula sp. K1]KZX49712.1 hypothetical protein AV929_18600 [Haloarcula sp. K1]